MKKALRFLLTYPLQLTGALLVCYALLAALCLPFGTHSLFGTYLLGYTMAFFLVVALCAAQMTASWCPLGLSLGATRRALQKGLALAWLALAALAQGVNLALGRLTFTLFPAERLDREWLTGLSRYPLEGFGLALFVVGASLWTGTLQLNARPVLQKVLLVLFDILLYAQIFVFLVLSNLTAALPFWALGAYSAALAVLGAVFTAATLKRIKNLAVSQS